MSKITALKTRLKKFTPAALGVGLVTLAGSASAADLSASINAAVADGTANVGVVAAGLVAVAAVMMAVGLVVRALSK